MLLKDKIEIEKWLNKYHIKNYELLEDKEYGYIVNVNGSVNLNNQRLKSIDVKFNIIEGSFFCNNNKLKNLKGCPEIIKRNFYCNNNKLNSLNYGPKIVDGFFNCSKNKLESLKGCPEIIKGNFYCNNNKLNSLNYSPKIIEGFFNCNLNKLNIEGIKDLIDIKNNYIDIDNNLELGELQNINDFNELKKMLIIYKEKEKLDILITNKISNDIIKIVEKINKI